MIQAGDLTQTLAGAADGIRTVPWSSRSSVVGKTAAVGLVPGSLLNPSQLATGTAILRFAQNDMTKALRMTKQRRSG